MNTKYYKMPHQLAQSVLNYLANQPYSQVFEIIFGLQNMEEFKDTPTVEKAVSEVNTKGKVSADSSVSSVAKNQPH